MPPPSAYPTNLPVLPPAATKKGVTYTTDIKPLLEASCIRCHGAERPKAGLRLDSLENILKGSKEGPVVVAGNSAMWIAETFADIGGYVGHSASHPDILDLARKMLAKAKKAGTLADFHVSACGDDLELVMTHWLGNDAKVIAMTMPGMP